MQRKSPSRAMQLAPVRALHPLSTWWRGGRVTGQRRTTPGTFRAALARQWVRPAEKPTLVRYHRGATHPHNGRFSRSGAIHRALAAPVATWESEVRRSQGGVAIPPLATRYGRCRACRCAGRYAPRSNRAAPGSGWRGAVPGGSSRNNRAMRSGPGRRSPDRGASATTSRRAPIRAVTCAVSGGCRSRLVRSGVARKAALI